MTAILGEPRTLPVVAVLYRVPLFVKALRGVFDRLADVHAFPSDEAAEPLVRWLRPDALVVDDEPAEFALRWGTENGVPVVRVNLVESQVVVLRKGTWQIATTDSSPNAVRNAVLVGLAEEWPA